MTIPVVSAVGRSKIRLEAPESEYTLDLSEAQELASSIALTLESIQGGYNMPHEPTRKRTLEISKTRRIRVSGGRRAPNVKLKHAPVIQLSTEAAHELVAVIISAIETTEDKLEAQSIEPYPG